MIARCFRRQPEDGEVFPGGVNVLTQVGFGVGRWIRGDDIESTRKVQGGPACANHSCANDCDSTNWLIQGHRSSPLSNFSLASRHAALAGNRYLRLQGACHSSLANRFSQRVAWSETSVKCNQNSKRV